MMSGKIKPMVLDGGVATELERLGHCLTDHLWSARLLHDNPESIARVHSDYLLAGADIITSCTYQASTSGFSRIGLSPDESELLIRRGVGLAIESVDKFFGESRDAKQKPLVAASVGPYGAVLADGSEYRGQYNVSRSLLLEFHEARWAALQSSGADLLLCETIPAALELDVLLELAANKPKVPVWISLQCRDEFHLADGTELKTCVEKLHQCPAIEAFGVNCVSPQLATRLLNNISNLSDRPLVVYANSGEIWNAQQRRWEPNSNSDVFGDECENWLTYNLAAVGGCCRTTPAQIASMRKRIDDLFGNEIPDRC